MTPTQRPSKLLLDRLYAAEFPQEGDAPVTAFVHWQVRRMLLEEIDALAAELEVLKKANGAGEEPKETA